jgi:hypothetical protein
VWGQKQAPTRVPLSRRPSSGTVLNDLSLLHIWTMVQSLTVLDPVQLQRIEATHRGFLYQHLFATACLLQASAAGASAVIVEADEDVEVILPSERVYAQVKTRSRPLARGDIASALDRGTSPRGQRLPQRVPRSPRGQPRAFPARPTRSSGARARCTSAVRSSFTGVCRASRN